tara:strand:- start:651 stop:1340 length:690 start_codon:yes stop_codon:yes gene_type:complete
MSQSKKSVLGTLRRTAIHALGGEEKRPSARPAVTHARVDRIEPQIKPNPYGPGSVPGGVGPMRPGGGIGWGERVPQGLSGRPNRPNRPATQIKPAFGYRPGQNKPWKGAHLRERGGSGNRVQGISDVAGSRSRDLRTRASNETSGMGQHLGKSTAHSQVIQAVNAETANRARTDHGKTDFLSSSGGNPSRVSHRHPSSAISGTHQISPHDARGMIAHDGMNTIAKAVVA